MATRFGVLLVVFIALSISRLGTSNKTVSLAATASNGMAAETKVVDKVTASNIAATVAQEVHLAVAPSIMNHADKLTADNNIHQDDSGLALQKPQIVATKAQSNRSIVHYTVKAGDSLAKIADKFGVSEITIRWSNGIDPSAEAQVGSTLSIPPVNGIVYTVKAGDSINSIASKYSADKNVIIAFNDIELSGIKTGQALVLPGGVLPDAERPGYETPSMSTSTATYAQNTGIVGYGGNGGDTWYMRSGTPMYSGNKYFFGNCTSYAYDRRVELGLRVGGNWGNAAEWSYNAAASGYTVNRTPSVGAIIQTGAGWFGHVGIVEKLLPNGDIQISEMNYYGGASTGFNIVSGRTIPASAVGSFAYIH